MPLKIDLKAGEKFIINGAVLTVGKDGRSLVLETDAMLLRDRDVMQPRPRTVEELGVDALAPDGLDQFELGVAGVGQ